MSRLIDADEIKYQILKPNTNPSLWVASKEAIALIPTVDAVPVVHGHWKGKPIAGYSTVKCSVCGEAFLENSGDWSYCPHCGAKMDEVTE